MVKIIGPRRKRWYDDEADWVPPKGRKFVMKGQEPKPEEPQAEDKIKTDAEGMDKAYAQGDAFGQDEKMFVAGSHTGRDWFDDVTKIPQWQMVPAGLNPVTDIMNTWWGRKILGTGDLRQSERYQKARDYLVAHPETTLLEGHSLGGAVVLQLQKDFPERNLKTVTYGAPVWDPFGRQKRDIGQENVLRFSNKGDIVSALDNSALKTSHPDPFSHKPSFWHDFHNKEQAGGRLGGNVIEQQQQATIQPDFSMDEPDDTKMTAMTE